MKSGDSLHIKIEINLFLDVPAWPTQSFIMTIDDS